MDEQTRERMAKLAALELKRRLSKHTPLGDRAQDAVPDRVAVEMIDGVEHLRRMVTSLDELAEERLGDLEALQKKYTALREEWEAERDTLDALEKQRDLALATAAHSRDQAQLLDSAQAEVARLQALNGGKDTRIERLDELETEVEMLRSSQTHNKADEELVAEVEMLRSTQVGPREYRGVVIQKMVDRTAEESDEG